MKLNEPGRQKLGRHKPRKLAQHAQLYSDIQQAKKEGTFDSPGHPQAGGGGVISASAVPHTAGERGCGVGHDVRIGLYIDCKYSMHGAPYKMYVCWRHPRCSDRVERERV